MRMRCRSPPDSPSTLRCRRWVAPTAASAASQARAATALPAIVIVAGIIVAYGLAGLFGIAIATAADGERLAPAFIVVPFDLPRGNAAAYFPETNPLVPTSHRDPVSGCPASKKIAVRLRRDSD